MFLLDVPTSLWIALSTVCLTPVIYVAYNIIAFFVDVRRRGRAIDKFPGDPKHWLWGHLHLFPGPNEAGLKFNRERLLRYPRAHSMWITSLCPALRTCHPETVLPILKTADRCPQHVSVPHALYVDDIDMIDPFFGHGLKDSPRKRYLVFAQHGAFGCEKGSQTGEMVQFNLRKLRKASILGPTRPVLNTNGTRLYPGLNEAGLQHQRERTVSYPLLYRVWTGNNIRPSVIVHHPDTVKIILRTSEPKPMGLGVYRYGKNWIGDGLLLSSGAKWARNRRLLTPAFHFDVLKPYILVKNRAVELLLDKMAPYAESGKSFEMFSNASLLTFDIILRCAFSYENDVQLKGESHPYVQAVASLGDLWVKRGLQPWFHFDFLYNTFSNDSKLFKKYSDYVHSISGEVIAKRKQFLKEHGEEALKKERYLDFLDILLTARDDEGVGLSDQEIRDEVDTFLFEGHDTTASAISWALYSLAEHPEHQTLCQQEIDNILDGRSNDTITIDDLPELKYLTLCIKESMRLHCPVPFIERQTVNEITIDGVTLPPRSVIDIQIYNLHHNPAVWEEPMEFRPSRFLPENLAAKDNFAFIPFSAGPRNCIGQHFAMHEQKVVLARILRRYTLALDPAFKVEKKISVVMKTQNGMLMKIAPRQL